MHMELAFWIETGRSLIPYRVGERYITISIWAGFFQNTVIAQRLVNKASAVVLCFSIVFVNVLFVSTVDVMEGEWCVAPCRICNALSQVVPPRSSSLRPILRLFGGPTMVDWIPRDSLAFRS
jgi:hypothetical protein